MDKDSEEIDCYEKFLTEMHLDFEQVEDDSLERIIHVSPYLRRGVKYNAWGPNEFQLYIIFLSDDPNSFSLWPREELMAYLEPKDSRAISGFSKNHYFIFVASGRYVQSLGEVENRFSEFECHF